MFSGLRVAWEALQAQEQQVNGAEAMETPLVFHLLVHCRPQNLSYLLEACKSHEMQASSCFTHSKRTFYLPSSWWFVGLTGWIKFSCSNASVLFHAAPFCRVLKKGASVILSLNLTSYKCSKLAGLLIAVAKLPSYLTSSATVTTPASYTFRRGICFCLHELPKYWVYTNLRKWNLL